jgi:putative solute:sodium symporter small subunit
MLRHHNKNIEERSMSRHTDNSYWRANVRILSVLLGIWLVVSFLLSIVFVDELDTIRIGGFGLGFWMAQQGSIYVYLVLIFGYNHLMDRLDRKHGVDEQSLYYKQREN